MKEKSLPMRPPACAQPLIAVRDVPAASRWYQRLLGCHSLHGGSEYEQLGWQADGHDFFMQLHAWGEHDHPNLGNEQAAPHGYGVLLWFEVQAFDEAVQRAQSLNAEMLKPSFSMTGRSTVKYGCAIWMDTWWCWPALMATPVPQK